MFSNSNCEGDDSYDHTITDKVQAYNPQEKEWSVEVKHCFFIEKFIKD